MDLLHGPRYSHLQVKPTTTTEKYFRHAYIYEILSTGGELGAGVFIFSMPQVEDH